jgi:hypothetical protein
MWNHPEYLPGSGLASERMSVNVKHPGLLGDPDLQRWFNNLSKGIPIVVDIHLWTLGRFCNNIGTTPKRFVKMLLKKIEDVTQNFIDELEPLRKPSE